MPAAHDAIRCTVPQLIPQARSYSGGEISEPYDPQSIVPTSDPRPHVEFSIIDEGAQGPSVDPNTGDLVVWANWRVSDPLSGVVPTSQTIEEVRFFADGQQLDSVSLDDRLQPSSSSFPFQEYELDTSGLIELRVPAQTDGDGIPRTWGAAAVVLEARTSANAAGHVGFDRSAVVFSLVDAAGPGEAGAFLVSEKDEADPDSTDIYMRSEISRIEHIARSQSGVVESIAFALSPIDPITASDITVEMIGPYFLSGGTPVYGVVQPERLILRVDPSDPNTHYLVFSEEGNTTDFVQLVFISDEAFDTAPIVPENIRRTRVGDDWQFEIVNGDGPPIAGYDNVIITTLGEYQEILIATEAPPLDDRPLNEGDIRLFYEMLATDDRAVLRLQAFDAVGGEIVIADRGLPFNDWFVSPYKSKVIASDHF
ncbi:MAG: hypothetical protein AAFY15_11145, partial [Cyanobacteria bacterium J06648_11]